MKTSALQINVILMQIVKTRLAALRVPVIQGIVGMDLYAKVGKSIVVLKYFC